MSATAYLSFAFCVFGVLYAPIQLAHAWFRGFLAVSYLRGSRQGASWQPAQPPSVDVLVTCYNERSDNLDMCLTALEAERTRRYMGTMRIFVVDDASRNRAALRPVFERHPECRLYPLATNRGKRDAQGVIAWKGNAEIVVVLDSDTVISPGAIHEIVRPFQNKQVGAVCGNLRPLAKGRPRNAMADLLFRAVHQEYWRLFERARASQSRFGTVLCCNGGFSAYRRAVLREVWDRHVNQTFRGRRCKSGDDLHLTLLILEHDYDSVFQPTAWARTDVPATFVKYCRQQYRWSRTFVREFGLAFAVVWKRRSYPVVDLLVQAATPVALTLSVLLFLVGWWMQGFEWIGQQGPLMLATSASTLGAAALQARGGPGILYGTMQLALVLPLRLLALFTPRRDTWKTRDLGKQARAAAETGSMALDAVGEQVSASLRVSKRETVSSAADA